MGPYYSTVGAAQYLINQGAKSIVAATLKAPGTDFNNQGAVELAKENNIPGKSVIPSRTLHLPFRPHRIVFDRPPNDGGGHIGNHRKDLLPVPADLGLTVESTTGVRRRFVLVLRREAIDERVDIVSVGCLYQPVDHRLRTFLACCSNAMNPSVPDSNTVVCN